MKITLRITFTILTLAFASLSALAEEAPVKITELFKRDHPELAGKEIVVKRIELGPGVSAPPHVHPGMVTGYVETGTLEFQLKGGPLLKLKAGDTFFEPAGSHHMVARNTDATAKVVIIAFVVNPKGAPLSTPIEEHAP
ncbi:MAG: cupin domain-containing protein [Verrucomicrobiota bacterium]